MVRYFVSPGGMAKVYLIKYGNEDTTDLKVRATNNEQLSE